MMLAFVPETDDKDEHFSVMKLASYGYLGIDSGELEHLLKSMETGFMKKYFTVPKAK